MTKLPLIAFALLASTAASAGTPVFGVSSPTAYNQNLNLDLGMDFTVNSPLTIGSLGAFTNGSSPIAVTLYKLTSASTGTAVATATVGGTPAAGTDFAFTAIAPVALATGSYQINARYTDPANGDYNPYEGGTATATFNSLGGKLTFAGDFYNYPSSGGIATTLDVPSPNGYGAGTFATVPEPAAWTLLVAGFGLVGVAARRRAFASA